MANAQKLPPTTSPGKNNANFPLISFGHISPMNTGAIRLAFPDHKPLTNLIKAKEYVFGIRLIKHVKP